MSQTMGGNQRIDWTDPESAAKNMAGNWRKFDSFAWHGAYNLEDADSWAIVYTSNRDSGLLDQSNEAEITNRLRPFSEGDDPDLVFEAHSHWAVGHLTGFSIRVIRDDGTITAAFEEFCDIQTCLEEYPVLNDDDYGDREYHATLENYRNEMWSDRDSLPVGWPSDVYRWFGDNGLDRFTENRDDQGGWAPRERIVEALQDLGFLPTVVVTN